jgi:hypothetical protein
MPTDTEFNEVAPRTSGYYNPYCGNMTFVNEEASGEFLSRRARYEGIENPLTTEAEIETARVELNKFRFFEMLAAHVESSLAPSVNPPTLGLDLIKQEYSKLKAQYDAHIAEEIETNPNFSFTIPEFNEISSYLGGIWVYHYLLPPNTDEKNTFEQVVRIPK